MCSGRFDVAFGNYLPCDDDTEKLVGECPECGQEFFEGDDVYKFEGDYFCDALCLVSFIGAIHTEAKCEGE